MPGTYNFDAYVGDTKELTISVLDGTTPVDYTSGFTFLAEIASDRLPATTETAAFTVTAPSPGTLSLVLPATEADTLGAFVTDPELGQGTAYWDLQVTETSSGRVFTLLTGRVKVIGDVSRA